MVSAMSDWFYERQEFEDAIQRNVINNDEGNSAAWGKKKLSELETALRPRIIFWTTKKAKLSWSRAP
jgi:hypothetical protein